MVRDIMLDAENEVKVESGDIVIADSRFQHVRHLFEAEKGFYKFSPTSGVGASVLINDELAPEELLRLVRAEVERDGFKVRNIEIDGDYEDA
jgi:hypothetical protein